MPAALLLALALLVLVLSWSLPPLYVLGALSACLLVVVAVVWPTAGFCFLAFSVPWLSGFPATIASIPVTATELLVAGIAAAWLAEAAWHKQNPVPSTLWTSYLMLFLVAISLSIIPAQDRHASAREVLKWVEVAVVYFAAVRLIPSFREVRWVFAALVLAGVTQALLGYAQVAFHLGPAAFGVQRAFFRAYGTFDQPNPYAGYLNLTLMPALSTAMLLPRSVQRTAYGLASLLILGGLLASGSRGALLGTAVALLVIVPLALPWLRKLTGVGVVGVAGLAWLASLGLLPTSPFQRVLNAIGLGNVSFGNVNDTNFSAVERAAHWLAGVRMFAAHPLLGVGMGNYGVAYPGYHPRGWYVSLQHAHNYYINIAAEAGIVGLTAYVLVAGSALWYSYAAAKRALEPAHRAVILGVLGALAATAFHNLFDVLYVHGLAVLLGLMLALAVVASGHDRSARVDQPPARCD